MQTADSVGRRWCPLVVLPDPRRRSPLYGLSRSVILGRMDRHDEAQTQLAAVQNDLKRYALAD
ncbi:MAG: hypothetical protein AAFP69_17405, partial [Planctomycetota bacterium]